MTDWVKTTVSDISLGVAGGPFGSSLGRKDYTLTGVPVIRGAQLTQSSQFSHNDLVFVSEAKANQHTGNLAFPGDLIVTQRGTLGQVGRIPVDAPYQRYLLSQSQMKITIDPSLADAQFVYYLLLGPEQQHQLTSAALSAGVPHINLAMLREMTLLLPSLTVQRAIASVLLTIDDLIENNRRRVALLEQMAREIYTEWFVRYRFPGHESATCADSPLGPIPSGWDVVALGDVLQLKYGKGLPERTRHGGPVPVVGSAGVVGWHDAPLIAGPAIVLGRKGNVGSVTWVDDPCWPIDTTYFVDSQVSLPFLAEQLRNMEFINTHAAVPGLDREQVYGKRMVLPPVALLNQHREVFEALHRQARNLETAVERLTQMRDLLLPKLVTGQIDVSSLSLD